MAWSREFHAMQITVLLSALQLLADGVRLGWDICRRPFGVMTPVSTSVSYFRRNLGGWIISLRREQSFFKCLKAVTTDNLFPFRTFVLPLDFQKRRSAINK
jgi:hypothetical protein